jgi:hypothetical protein
VAGFCFACGVRLDGVHSAAGASGMWCEAHCPVCEPGASRTADGIHQLRQSGRITAETIRGCELERAIGGLG